MGIYITRHGQTDWNIQNRICGRTDIELNETGKQQAIELGKQLKAYSIDRIIASPMLRTRQTTKAAILAAGMSESIVSYDKRLIEQDYGDFEGTDSKAKVFFDAKGQFAYSYPNGESMLKLASRAYQVIDEVLLKYPDENVLLLCHGGVCRSLFSYFNNMTNEDYVHFSMNNCEIIKLC